MNLELAYQDLSRSHDICLRDHNGLTALKFICININMPNGKDHKWEVRPGQAPVKDQKCFCGEEQI